MRHSRLCAILLLCAVTIAACSEPEGGDVPQPPAAGSSPTTAGEALPSPTSPPAAATATAPRPEPEPPTPTTSDDPAETPAVVPTTAVIPTAAAPTPDSGPTPTAPAAGVTPTPTATLPPAPGSLRIEQWGYSQSEAYAEVSWGILISNQDRVNAVLDTAYVLTFMDEAGEAIETDDGYVDIILPGAEIGVGGSTFLPEGAIARSMRVDLRPGYRSDPPIEPQIAIDDVAIFQRARFATATGAAQLRFDRPVEDIDVYAVAFNQEGEIIGGGNTHLPFLLPGEATGVEVSVPSVGQPARVELYPLITGASLHADQLARLDPPEETVAVVDDGFGHVATSGEVGWAFVVENADATLAFEPVSYQVTAWGEGETVLATNVASVALLLPGERLGVAGSVFVPPGHEPERVDVQVLARSSREASTAAGFLTVDETSLAPDPYTPRATGVVSNDLDADLEAISVFAVGYDAGGAIIGGGVAFIDLVPARGETPVEVALAVDGEPARVELYATSSPASQIP